jgi:hypothetical protein
MTKQFTIEVSDELGDALEEYRDRMPEILARGLAAVQMSEQPAYQDATALLDLLAQQPSPRVMLDLKPSPALQERVSALLERSKSGEISREEAVELERYLTVEHLVRLAKGHAYHRMGSQA